MSVTDASKYLLNHNYILQPFLVFNFKITHLDVGECSLKFKEANTTVYWSVVLVT